MFLSTRDLLEIPYSRIPVKMSTVMKKRGIVINPLNMQNIKNKLIFNVVSSIAEANGIPAVYETGTGGRIHLPKVNRIVLAQLKHCGIGYRPAGIRI